MDSRKRMTVFAVLALLLPLSAAAQFRDGAYSALYDSETVTALKEHVNTLACAQMEGRKAGTAEEKEAAEYVWDRLSAYGVEMLTPRSGDEFGLSREGGDTLVSRNVYGFIQGYDRELSDKFIVVGARLDNLGSRMMTVDGQSVLSIYNGANGNASGLAMLVELARMVSTNALMFRRSVVFVAFGASCESFAGSWYFADREFRDKVELMVNLDMLGTGLNGFYAYTSSNNDVNALVESLKGELQPVHPQITSAEPYPSDHRSFYAKEIPSVLFTTGRYTEHNTPKDTPSIIDYESMERELEYVYNFLVKASSGKAPAFRQEEVKPQKNTAAGRQVLSYFDCDVKPTFLGSSNPGVFLSKWVYQYLKYPGKAIEEGIQGTVQVNFVVDEKGNVTDVTVVRGVHPLLDEEAVKVVAASPKWKPARLHGNKVASAITVGVEFRLKRKGEGHSFGINGYKL